MPETMKNETIIQSSTNVIQSPQRSINKRIGNLRFLLVCFKFSIAPYPGLVHEHYRLDPRDTPSIYGCIEVPLKCLPHTVELGP